MTSLHYTTTGAPERPAVLFLHGFMGTAADWTPITDLLKESFFCLAADLPGHGRSLGLEEEGYTMTGAAAGLAGVLDAENLGACAVVGYSMGGRLALYFALHQAARCRQLVLESASPGLRTDSERAARRQRDAERATRMQRDLRTFLEDWHRLPLFASLARQPERVERRIATRLQNDSAELGRSLRGMGTGAQPSLWAQLPALQPEALALAGALDEKYVRLAREMAGQAPRLRAAVLPEAGHAAHLEQPEAFAEQVARFLDGSSQ